MYGSCYLRYVRAVFNSIPREELDRSAVCIQYNCVAIAIGKVARGQENTREKCNAQGTKKVQSIRVIRRYDGADAKQKQKSRLYMITLGPH